MINIFIIRKLNWTGLTVKILLHLLFMSFSCFIFQSVRRIALWSWLLVRLISRGIKLLNRLFRLNCRGVCLFKYRLLYFLVILRSVAWLFLYHFSLYFEEQLSKFSLFINLIVSYIGQFFSFVGMDGAHVRRVARTLRVSELSKLTILYLKIIAVKRGNMSFYLILRSSVKLFFLSIEESDFHGFCFNIEQSLFSITYFLDHITFIFDTLIWHSLDNINSHLVRVWLVVRHIHQLWNICPGGYSWKDIRNAVMFLDTGVKKVIYVDWPRRS